MNWETVLTSSIVATLVTIGASFLIEVFKVKVTKKEYRYKELHRILTETENVHGFLKCKSISEYMERMYFFWGYLEISKPLLDEDYRIRIEEITTSIKVELEKMNKDQTVPPTLAGTLDNMVQLLKNSLQEQIIKLI